MNCTTFAACLAAIVALAGCVSSGTEVTAQQAAAFTSPTDSGDIRTGLANQK